MFLKILGVIANIATNADTIATKTTRVESSEIVGVVVIVGVDVEDVLEVVAPVGVGLAVVPSGIS